VSEIERIRQSLVEAGGRMSQDLGLGRIVGQILVHIYLSAEDQSLDEIASDLGLSKASVSIAVRQLDRFGMIVKAWKSGDRKNYYRTAANFTEALHRGVIEYFNQKLSIVHSEIKSAKHVLEQYENRPDPYTRFLTKRVTRALELNEKAYRMLNNPMVDFLLK
jgi:HTH-type transcriptional regulator, glycine betaine synthesis regulator